MTEAHRLLAFEVAGTLYALPIHGVLEVAERGRLTCVPTLPGRVAGVMNWHGDALPVVSPELVLGGASAEAANESAAVSLRESLATEHVIVVPDQSGQGGRLGLPVDRVLGLVDGTPGRRSGGQGDLIVERRRVRGRVVSVLDPRQLVARAEGVIERTVH